MWLPFLHHFFLYCVLQFMNTSTSSSSDETFTQYESAYIVDSYSATMFTI